MKGAYWTDLKEKLQVNMIWLKEQIEFVGNGKESNVLSGHHVKIQYLKIIASTDACKAKELQMGFLENSCAVSLSSPHIGCESLGVGRGNLFF